MTTLTRYSEGMTRIAEPLKDLFRREEPLIQKPSSKKLSGTMITAHIPSRSVREFDTGATRTQDVMRPDPEGFLSPIVIERFCEYMNKHRVQADGSIRASDNWQKGMPQESYIKGLLRHVQHAWTRFRGYPVRDKGAAADLEEDLCATLFNAQGMLHEILVEKTGKRGRVS